MADRVKKLAEQAEESGGESPSMRRRVAAGENRARSPQSQTSAFVKNPLAHNSPQILRKKDISTPPQVRTQKKEERARWQQKMPEFRGDASGSSGAEESSDEK
eukprot:c9089_g1_i1.p3 GENE.c9089_g1_i1~~c9089_g1_i1.p3  ORF type:complete len:103 (-),score=12.29 c9089_g1_i1:25-333(-)